VRQARDAFAKTIRAAAPCPVAKRHRKLASYEVAGNAPHEIIYPERMPDSNVPSGRIYFGTTNPARRAGLISDCRSATKRAGFQPSLWRA
jgi:hypothetical protein